MIFFAMCVYINVDWCVCMSMYMDIHIKYIVDIIKR